MLVRRSVVCMLLTVCARKPLAMKLSVLWRFQPHPFPMRLTPYPPHPFHFSRYSRHLRHHPVAVRRARTRARHRRREQYPQYAQPADKGRRHPRRLDRRQPSLSSPFAATVTVASTDAVSLSEDDGGPWFIVVAVTVPGAAGRRRCRGRRQQQQRHRRCGRWGRRRQQRPWCWSCKTRDKR